MSYTINNSRGSVVTTVTPGTTQVVGGITLIGKNYTGYGELIAEDLVKMLENQANTTNPNSPLEGQLWYDTTENTLKVYDTNWQRLQVTVGTSAPSSPQAGEMWLDTSAGDGVFKVYNATATKFVASAMASSKTRSTAVTLKIGDNSWATTARQNGFTSNSNAEVDVTAVVATDGAGNNEVVAVFSPASFDISNQTANIADSSKLEYDIYNNFSVTTTGAGSQSLQAGLNIRDGFLDPAASAPLADEALAVQDNSNPSTKYNSSQIMILSKSTAQEHVGDLKPSANNSVNLGATDKRYSTIYGVSTSAQYGDIAERYHADASMDPGTVVALGGVEEITRTAERADENVFGVISSKPAFRMNDVVQDDVEYPFVAFSGRVPCLVKGPVAKGERLVSSDIPGVAVRADITDSWKSIIGRALTDKTSEEVEKITIAIGVK